MFSRTSLLRIVPFLAKKIQYASKPRHKLCNFFDINESKAQHICLKYPVVNKLDEERVKGLIAIVTELGFTKEVLIEEPSLFSILPITLKYRYQVLNECGIENITSECILNYLTIVKQKPIAELRRLRLIPSYLNVENKLAGYMTQWPTSLTTLISGDVEQLTLHALRIKIIQRYLELNLDLSKEEFFRGIKTYPTLKHRPLQVVNETLAILKSEIMMTDQKIKNNLYLAHVDPENLKKIIYWFRSIGGIDIKEVIRLHPKLATKNYKTLVEIRQILQENGIGNEAQIRCFDVYTLGPNTVRERIQKAKEIPEFNTFFTHPRFLKMIHYNKKATKRMMTLYNNNKKCLSLNILSGSSAHFETFEKAPGDRLGKGKDLIFCLSQSFKEKYSKSDIRNSIKRHPFWINIPLVQIKYVYEQLLQEFSPEDIFENCPILLYPWCKIKDVLNIYKDQKDTKVKLYLHECVDASELSKSQKLSLALYLLEKKHYFTGNGVWSEEKRALVDSLESKLNQVNVKNEMKN